MNTLLTQIEAVVNSRPLGSDPDTECGYLSLAHFLIGRPYTVVPEGDLSSINSNKLSYWQHVQNVFQGLFENMLYMLYFCSQLLYFFLQWFCIT